MSPVAFYFIFHISACVSCYIIVCLNAYTIYLAELHINACLYVHNIHNIRLFKFVNSVLKAICK